MGSRELWLGFLLAAGPAASAPAPGTTLVYPPWSHCYGLHRVDQTHLALRAGFRYRFRDPQGVCALKLAAEDDPATRKDDDELTVFGVNSGQDLLIYNTSITAIAFYGSHGKGPGQFDGPTGVAASRDGHVVVADTGNDRLHVLMYRDDRLHHVRFLAGEYFGRRLRHPAGVALEGGEITVCDPENDRLVVLDLVGNPRREIRPERDGRPLLERPFAVAVLAADDEMNFFGEEFVAVTDSGHARLWKLDREGQPLAVRRAAAVAPDASFDWVAIDYHASVWCSDRGGRLHKFDRGLDYLLAFGRPGKGELEFDEPRGLGLYRRFGQLFVAEREGASYLWIGADVFTPALGDLRRLDGGRWSATARYFLTEYAHVGLDLVDAAGTARVVLQRSSWTPPGAQARPLQFELPPESGALRLRVTAAPVYSSRKFLRVEKTAPPVRFGDAGKQGGR